MKRTASVLIISIVAMILLVCISSNLKDVRADSDYSVTHVSHTVEIMHNGYILVNDTIQLNITGGVGPYSFLIGFPDKYGSEVLTCFAHGSSESFTVTPNVPLEKRVGFYAAEVEFPHGAPDVFTVGFVLSNNLLTQDAQNTSIYTLDFPAYPSLTTMAHQCNVSIILPEGAVRLSGSVESFTYGREDLPEFTYSPGGLAFLSAENEILIADVGNWRREIRIGGLGEIEGSDTYEITNKASAKLTYFEVFLPFNTSQPVAVDQFGRRMGDLQQPDKNASLYLVNLTLPVETDRLTRFTVEYQLSNNYVSNRDANSFAVNLSLLEHQNYYIPHASIAVVLPEGARVTSLGGNLTGHINDISRSVFQETVTIERQNIIAMSDFNIEIAYEYTPLWLSFRPTIWVWVISAVGCVVFVAAWRIPKGPTRVSAPTAMVRLRPEHLKSFVDAYEEKKRITAELESLETRVQKGRIPRRRYKVLSKTLEARLSTLSRNLEEPTERIRAAGGRYSDFMRQLEIAETEINEVETNVKSIEGRHNRGELSLEAHRKLLADYQHRRENAQNTINGILLRLREETR